MAEELLEYENTVEDPEDGGSWVARVLGAERSDGTWVGWIRFREAGGDGLLETDRETTQPNRDDLLYWAKGVTYFYLEGALARAQRRDRPAAPVQEPAVTAAEGVPGPDEVGPRLKLVGASEGVIRELMNTTTPRSGQIREVPDAGALVYEGTGGAGELHYIALRFGSRNTGAVLSNWLWSRLRGSGVTVHVDGARIELSQDALSHAIVGE